VIHHLQDGHIRVNLRSMLSHLPAQGLTSER
jgi:hypothetical protein